MQVLKHIADNVCWQESNVQVARPGLYPLVVVLLANWLFPTTSDWISKDFKFDLHI